MRIINAKINRLRRMDMNLIVYILTLLVLWAGIISWNHGLLVWAVFDLAIAILGVIYMVFNRKEKNDDWQ